MRLRSLLIALAWVRFVQFNTWGRSNSIMNAPTCEPEFDASSRYEPGSRNEPHFPAYDPVCQTANCRGPRGPVRVSAGPASRGVTPGAPADAPAGAAFMFTTMQEPGDGTPLTFERVN